MGNGKERAVGEHDIRRDVTHACPFTPPFAQGVKAGHGAFLQPEFGTQLKFRGVRDILPPAFLDGLEQNVAVAVDLVFAESLNREQTGFVGGQAPGQFNQHGIGQDLEGGTILLARFLLAPVPQRFQYIQLTKRHFAHGPHVPEGAIPSPVYYSRYATSD